MMSGIPNAGASVGGSRLKAAILPLLALAAALVATPSHAGSFQVSPVNIELQAGRRVTMFTLQNTGTAPLSARIRLLRWTQEQGRDVYTETTDLIASPPFMTVAPGARQIVRIGERGGALSGSYRVMVEEIPPARTEGSGIGVALRMNLPLHVIAAQTARPEVSWAAWRTASGELVVEGRNTGTRHLQVLSLAASAADGNEQTLSQRMGTILPSGGALQWSAGRASQARVGDTLPLVVRSAGGVITQHRIVVETR